MQLPYTSNDLLFWLDPARKFVSKDSSNRILSILNRVDGNLILPNTATGPTWVDNSLNGQPTLAFDGTQSLLYNLNPNVTSVGIQKPFMITMVARNTVYGAKNICACMAGSQTSSNPGYLLLFFNNLGQNIFYSQRIVDNANSAFNNPGASLFDLNYHVFTIAYDGIYLRLRMDGVEILSSLVSTSLTNQTTQITLNQICIGYLAPQKAVPLGAFIDYLIGNIASVMVYSANIGMPLDYSHEEYLKAYFNL